MNGHDFGLLDFWAFYIFKKRNLRKINNRILATRYFDYRKRYPIGDFFDSSSYMGNELTSMVMSENQILGKLSSFCLYIWWQSNHHLFSDASWTGVAHVPPPASLLLSLHLFEFSCPQYLNKPMKSPSILDFTILCRVTQETSKGLNYLLLSSCLLGSSSIRQEFDFLLGLIRSQYGKARPRN